MAPHDWHYVDPDLDQRPWRRFFGDRLLTVHQSAGGGDIHLSDPVQSRPVAPQSHDEDMAGAADAADAQPIPGLPVADESPASTDEPDTRP